MSAAEASVRAWPPHAVHREYFTASEDSAEHGDKPFRIRLKRTGTMLDIPADKSIVEVLRDNGYAVETDCEDGYCGTCITRYLEGEPVHRDTVLSEGQRQTYVMICCARANSELLELDL